MFCCRGGTRTRDLRKTATLCQLSFTTDRTIIMPIGFHGPLSSTTWHIKLPPTGGREAHPVFLNLCSPFLDIGAACSPPTLSAHHSIFATNVAPVCNGWNHRPADSLVCYQQVKERVSVEGAGFEPAVCGRYKSIALRRDLDSCLRPLGQPSNYL